MELGFVVGRLVETDMTDGRTEGRVEQKGGHMQEEEVGHDGQVEQVRRVGAGGRVESGGHERAARGRCPINACSTKIRRSL